MIVETLEPRRSAEAAQVLARAFQQDPVWVYLFPDPVFRTTVLTWLNERWVRIFAQRGQAYMAGAGKGVALWFPPERPPEISLWNQLRAGLGWMPFRFGFRWVPRALRADYDVLQRQRQEIREPHWVLNTLGVDPAHQGRGVGAALLNHIFIQADRTRHPCHVITHNERNIAFYEHHGFQLIAKNAALPKGPPTCSLRRLPQ